MKSSSGAIRWIPVLLPEMEHTSYRSVTESSEIGPLNAVFAILGAALGVITGTYKNKSYAGLLPAGTIKHHERSSLIYSKFGDIE